MMGYIQIISVDMIFRLYALQIFWECSVPDPFFATYADVSAA